MSRSCRSKQALLRGLRPNAPTQQHSPKILCGVCPTRCIFCDIWKLATLVMARIPLSSRYSTVRPTNKIRRSDSSSSDKSSSSTSSSKSHVETYDWEESERMIDARFQTQRARLASIMSICTVEGADECEGLRMAHDRCYSTVSELLYQERVLEDTILRSRLTFDRSRRTSRDCGSSNSSYYSQERRPSMVGIAI